jgi:anti-sigma B factor antagonist
MSHDPFAHLLEAEEVGDVTVIRFRGRHIRDEEAIRAVARSLTRLVERDGRSRLLLDFAEIEHLASLIIAVLLKLRDRTRKAGGRLILCGLRPDVAEVFAITGVDKVFDIYPGEQQALASF